MCNTFQKQNKYLVSPQKTIFIHLLRDCELMSLRGGNKLTNEPNTGT